jgi:hypothetical protein
MTVKRIEIEPGKFLTVEAEDVAVPLTERSYRNIDPLLPPGTEPVRTAHLADAAAALSEQIEGLAALGKKIIDAAQPSSLELEASLSFTAEGGLPLLAKAGADAGIKVKIVWKEDE